MPSQEKHTAVGSPTVPDASLLSSCTWMVPTSSKFPSTMPTAVLSSRTLAEFCATREKEVWWVLSWRVLISRWMRSVALSVPLPSSSSQSGPPAERSGTSVSETHRYRSGLVIESFSEGQLDPLRANLCVNTEFANIVGGCQKKQGRAKQYS